MKEVGRIIRHHHARFNGTAPSDPTKGTDIPRGSRIIIIADSYDKITNVKNFLSGASIEKAIQFLKFQAGKIFDPDLAGSFLLYLESSGLRYSNEREAHLLIRDLKAGMTLSRDVANARGVLVLCKETVLTDNHIEQLQSYHGADPLIQGVFVHRKQKEEVPEYDRI
jgi:hypothetical protein